MCMFRSRALLYSYIVRFALWANSNKNIISMTQVIENDRIFRSNGGGLMDSLYTFKPGSFIKK